MIVESWIMVIMIAKSKTSNHTHGIESNHQKEKEKLASPPSSCDSIPKFRRIGLAHVHLSNLPDRFLPFPPTPDSFAVHTLLPNRQTHYRPVEFLAR